MYKFFSVFFVLFAFTFTFAQDNSVDVVGDGGSVLDIQYENVYFDGGEALLFDNGPLVTAAGQGCNSTGDLSALQNVSLGMNILGFGAQQPSNNYMADDFVVPVTDSWTIDSITTFCYQSNATTLTVNGVFIQIWDGQPGAGGTVIFGDLTTNRLQRAYLSNIYRASENTTAPCARRIQVAVATIGLTLQPGTYWVQVGWSGTAASGPWSPPVTLIGQTTTGNGLQYLGSSSTWGPAYDTGASGVETWQQAIPFLVYGTAQVVPVELTSFAAIVNDADVTLNWSTATETNNQGFQVERSTGSGYEVVGYVAGHGTTTETQNYSYTDQNVQAGSYTYRLKQIDFDGTFEYSQTVEVDVVGLKEYTLAQNYPNPFNPSTKINFSLAVESQVSLKVFNVLGQSVGEIFNGKLAAGSQEVTFDASGLNSGVYFYRLEATGIDGQQFTSVRKMILSK